MPPSTTQRNVIADFVAITGAQERVASTFLKRNAWKLDQACDAYFAQNPTVNNAALEKTDANLSKLFEKYRDVEKDEKETVGMEGIMKYCTDLGVNLEDASCLLVLEAVQAPALGEMTKEEYLKGWKQAANGRGSLDTLPKQRTYIQSQLSLLPGNMEVFQRVYRHTFFCNKERGQRALGIDMALASWETLFARPGMLWASPQMDWLQLWFRFLKEKWTNSVNRDMWNQTFKFFQKSIEDPTLSFWNEDGAWAVVIDQFVAYVKETGVAGPDKMEMD